MSEQPRMRIQCAGSVDIDGERMGSLGRDAYEALAALALDAPGFELGDSMTFELRLVETKGYPLGRAVMKDARDAKG